MLFIGRVSPFKEIKGFSLEMKSLSFFYFQLRNWFVNFQFQAFSSLRRMYTSELLLFLSKIEKKNPHNPVQNPLTNGRGLRAYFSLIIEM